MKVFKFLIIVFLSSILFYLIVWDIEVKTSVIVGLSATLIAVIIAFYQKQIDSFLRKK